MKHTRKPCDSAPHGSCSYCDGGLFLCAVCGAGEGELSSECPGERMTTEQRGAVFAGERDYFKGNWWERL